MAEKRIVRRHFYFSGRVQAVGFRYFAYRYASGLGLTGYVKNLWDERVEMEAQGEASKIDELVAKLEGTPSIRIESVQDYEMPLKEEKEFQITY